MSKVLLFIYLLNFLTGWSVETAWFLGISLWGVITSQNVVESLIWGHWRKLWWYYLSMIRLQCAMWIRMLSCGWQSELSSPPSDLYILYMENYKFIYGFTFRWRVKFKPLDRTWFGCAFPILNLLSSSLYKFSASCITIFVSQGIEKSQLTFCC